MTRISVGQRCANIDGAAVVLDALTIANDTVTVHLRIERSAMTDALDEANRLAWEKTESGTRGPGFPAEHFYERLRPTLTDELGTSYVLWEAFHGDENWRASWRFRPAPPGEVNRLTVTAYLDGASVSEHVINLDPQ